MENRLPARSTALGIAAALTVALVLCLLIGAGRGQAAGTATKRTCSTAGLRFSDQSGGATFSVAVAGLRAQTVSCATARSVASKVARDILHEVKVPARIAGLKVTVKEPCAGCTPDTQVSARSAAASVTFTVRGGA
jgi:hypothetical protein